MIRNALESRIDRSYKIRDLYKIFYGYTPGTMIVCPFHADTRASAKIFHDPDGDRLFCFSCNRQYSVSDLLKKFGQNLRDWDVVYSGSEPKAEKEKAYNFEVLDSFKKGEIGMEEFCKRIYYLEKK